MHSHTVYKLSDSLFIIATTTISGTLYLLYGSRHHQVVSYGYKLINNFNLIIVCSYKYIHVKKLNNKLIKFKRELILITSFNKSIRIW